MPIVNMEIDVYNKNQIEKKTVGTDSITVCENINWFVLYQQIVTEST